MNGATSLRPSGSTRACERAQADNFMTYQQRKQIIVVVIVVSVLALIGTGIYFKYIRHQPTCFDDIQNQKEEGIDCGGPCLSCERLTIKDIKTEWMNFLLLKDNRYDLAARLNNPNPNFGLSSFEYTFKLYDKSGNLIKEQKGINFILPGQTKYLIEGNVSVTQEVDKIELVLEKPAKAEWQKLKDYQAPNIYVIDRQFRYLDERTGASLASGLIKNDSPYDFESIIVAVILFDEERKTIGVNKTEVRTVRAGEERYFSAPWFTSIKEEVRSLEMQAETNLLSDENFMRRYGVPEKFQEY